MANPRYFEYALMIDRFGGFKRAALECGVSQPALSKGIAALEKEYGVSLFDRDSRPMVPTVYGKRVIEEAERIMEGEKTLRSHILQIKGVVKHKVRIGWGPYASKVYASVFAKAFNEKFPCSELVLQTCSWEVLPQLLRDRQIDLFVGDISSENFQNEFILLPFPPEKISYVCSPQHPLAKKKILAMKDILKHMLVLCDAPPWGKEYLKIHMPNFDYRESSARIRVNDFRLIREILLECPSISTMAPASCFAVEIAESKFVPIEIEGHLASCAGIAYAKTGSQTPILQDVVSLLKSVVHIQKK